LLNLASRASPEQEAAKIVGDGFLGHHADLGFRVNGPATDGKLGSIINPVEIDRPGLVLLTPNLSEIGCVEPAL
jgi:hypothetical protein